MSYVSRLELKKAYEDCIRRKRQTNNATDFEIDDSEKLESLYVELNMMTYTISKSIVFVLHDPNGVTYREVFAADFRDRIVHHLLINRLIHNLDEYDLIEDNYACRISKGTLCGVKRCQYHIRNSNIDDWIMKCDLKNCFNTLNKNLMYERFERFIITYMSEDRNMIFNLWLLRMIIEHCPQHEGNFIRKQSIKHWRELPSEKSMFNCDDVHGVAVGNLTSQIITNFFLSLLDHYVKDILNIEYYGRYVDDFFLISSKKRLLESRLLIEKFIVSMDLNISPKKFYLQPKSHGVRFIGFMIYEDRIYLSNNTIHKFDKFMKYSNIWMYNNYFIRNRNIDLQNLQRFLSTWNSYIGMFNHVSEYRMWRDRWKTYQYVRIIISRVCTMDRCGILRMKKSVKRTINNYYRFGIRRGKLKEET